MKDKNLFDCEQFEKYQNTTTYTLRSILIINNLAQNNLKNLEKTEYIGCKFYQILSQQVKKLQLKITLDSSITSFNSEEGFKIGSVFTPLKNSSYVAIMNSSSFSIPVFYTMFYMVTWTL